MDNINPNRVRQALSKLKEAVSELEAALSDADRRPPDPMPHPTRLIKRRKNMRRVTI
jgi:hypothetical protein